MLETNKNILLEKMPDLMRKLDGLQKKENVGINRARDGEAVLTLGRENRIWYLNSRYDTSYAAKAYAKRYDIRAYGTYFIFGFSDGRHIRELLKKCDDTNHIIVCEPCAEIFTMLCSYFDVSDILGDKRVRLYVPEFTESLEEIMECTLQYSDFTCIEFCILPGYDVLFRDLCEEFQDIIMEGIQNQIVKKGTCLNFQRIMPQNTLYNMQNLISHKHIGQLKEKLLERDIAEVPAIIVSAGPSLDKNIDELKGAQGKALIIVVDAALRAVIKAGIRPDIVCTVDPDPPERFFTDMDLRDVVWGCESMAKTSALKKFGHNIYYFGFFEKAWNETLSQMIGYPFPILPSGGSVSTLAFMLAVYLGFQKIVMIGQDLAFTGGRSHTAGIEGALGDNDAYIKSRYLMEVEGMDGTVLQTDFQMWYYKRWFEKKIMECGDALTIIDATEGGAKIEGAEIRRLCDVVVECSVPFDFKELEKEIPSAFNAADQECLREKIRDMRQQAMDLARYIDKQIQLQESIYESVKDETKITKESMTALKKMIEGNAKLGVMPLFDMMITYAQKEEYELGDNIYAKADMMLAELVEQSLSLFEGYKKATGMLIEDIEGILDEKVFAS